LGAAKRLRHSAVLLVLGTALLTVSLTSQRAAATASDSARQGGVFRVNVSTTGVDFVDPALSYDFIGWQILQATCVKLLNYPDRAGPAGARIRPEAAAAMPRISRGGKTYTFRVRSGYRFNTGEPVTAASFVRAFERALSPKMQSPGASFSGDIVGASAFSKGRTKRIAGIQVSGDQLTIRLSKQAPDFLARIGMMFFCAVPSDLPIDSRGVKTPPMAGPYYIASSPGAAPSCSAETPTTRGRGDLRSTRFASR
jgi:ABC-type oligopeptide transport system substrate-binding subunit